MEEIEEIILELEKSPLQNLCGAQECIYMEHYQNAAKTYKLSALARDTLKTGTEEKNSSSQAGSSRFFVQNSVNVLRIALVLHMLQPRIERALEKRADPTPETISDATMNMA